jgi:hypothetical protein
MEQPDPRSASADTIKAYADAERIARGGSYSYEAGMLSAFVEMLCRERDSLRRELRRTAEAPKSPTGLPVAEVSLEEATVFVEYEYRPGDPGRTYGPPEKCYEGWPAEVEILKMHVNGTWIYAADVLPVSVLDKWAEQIEEQITAADEAAMESYWESRAADREEQAA